MNPKFLHLTGTTAAASILALSAIVAPALASWATVDDPSDYNTDNNFDIRQVGITADGNLRLTVDGTVGDTIPSAQSQADLVYAYVFITNDGIIAVTSHQAEDSNQVGNDLEWHSHRVTLDSNFCVTSIEDYGKAKLHGDRLDVLQTDATTVSGALTAELTISGSQVCVSDVWDTAPDNLLS